MRYFRTVGNHIILVRVPVLHNIILVFWVPEINTTELRRAAHRAFKLLHEWNEDSLSWTYNKNEENTTLLTKTTDMELDRVLKYRVQHGHKLPRV